jgi:hypothetical protein
LKKGSLQEKKKTPAETAPIMARPGAPPTRDGPSTSSKARREAFARLSKTGRVEDAVNYLLTK